LAGADLGTGFGTAITGAVEYWSPTLHGRLPGRVALVYSLVPSLDLDPTLGLAGNTLHKIRVETLPTWVVRDDVDSQVIVGPQASSGLTVMVIDGSTFTAGDLVFAFLLSYRRSSGRYFLNAFAEVSYGWVWGEAVDLGLIDENIRFEFGLAVGIGSR
jgi:hypothetical protein